MAKKATKKQIMAKKATKKQIMAKKATKKQIIDPAKSYDQLEQALKDGHTVQLCSVGPNSEAVGWTDMQEIRREWSVGRYRIIQNK